MIYAVPSDRYPEVDRMKEETEFLDQNEQPWLVAVIDAGFIVRYCGSPYFRESTLQAELKCGETIAVKNAGVLFFATTDFDTYCLVRSILKEEYTDDIWESFAGMFADRFELDLAMLESEVPEQPNKPPTARQTGDGMLHLMKPAIGGFIRYPPDNVFPEKLALLWEKGQQVVNPQKVFVTKEMMDALAEQLPNKPEPAERDPWWKRFGSWLMDFSLHKLARNGK